MRTSWCNCSIERTYFSENRFFSSFSAAEKKSSISAAEGITAALNFRRRLASELLVVDSSSSCSDRRLLEGVVSLLWEIAEFKEQTQNTLKISETEELKSRLIRITSLCSRNRRFQNPNKLQKPHQIQKTDSFNKWDWIEFRLNFETHRQMFRSEPFLHELARSVARAARGEHRIGARAAIRRNLNRIRRVPRLRRNPPAAEVAGECSLPLSGARESES